MSISKFVPIKSTTIVSLTTMSHEFFVNQFTVIGVNEHLRYNIPLIQQIRTFIIDHIKDKVPTLHPYCTVSMQFTNKNRELIVQVITPTDHKVKINDALVISIDTESNDDPLTWCMYQVTNQI